ncbi:topoisomerase I damage affected protein 11 [Striga asiatica]|uniref:Topoisomerase I damage affected protein 11 n=1 Tax=Striga asiatica TaxID=4170 RepID=A0A5A7NY08_STRAF|nr:topoisomerase I damage affected protein 11 [Striga asiatica]
MSQNGRIFYKTKLQSHKEKQIRREMVGYLSCKRQQSKARESQLKQNALIIIGVINSSRNPSIESAWSFLSAIQSGILLRNDDDNDEKCDPDESSIILASFSSREIVKNNARKRTSKFLQCTCTNAVASNGQGHRKRPYTSSGRPLRTNFGSVKTLSKWQPHLTTRKSGHFCFNTLFSRKYV